LGNLCIVGLGLMGGSLALALKAAGWPDRITGVSRSADTLAAARGMGAVDAGTSDLAQGITGASAVILATPVRTLLRQVPEVGRHAGCGTLVLDMGSTKTEVCAALDRLPPGLEPVGGHPMCGKEIAGFAAADATLYRGKTFVLCPLPRTGDGALGRAREIAEAIGSQVMVLDPASHDRAVAAISHLPYLAAAALVNTVTAGNDPLAWALAASGFRDTTRVAASDVDMMLDILLTNREAILQWLGSYTLRLAVFQQALSNEDEAALRSYLTEAQGMRSKLHIA
jgi:prephenate dehydrogenase